MMCFAIKTFAGDVFYVRLKRFADIDRICRKLGIYNDDILSIERSSINFWEESNEFIK